MDDALFQAVVRYFLNYTENCRYLETLEERLRCVSVLKSPSDFSEITGSTFSDPVSIWFEKVESIEEEIARYRLLVIPMMKLLE